MSNAYHFDDTLSNIRRLVSIDEIQQAFLCLKLLLQKNGAHTLLNELIVLEGSWRELARYEQLNLIPTSEACPTRVRIRTALLDMVWRIQKGGITPQFPKAVQDTCDQVQVMLSPENLGICKSLLVAVLQQFPDYPRALVQLGVVEGLQNHPDVAISYLQKALNLLDENDPLRSETLANLGTAYSLVFRPDWAAWYWQLAKMCGAPFPELLDQWVEIVTPFTYKSTDYAEKQTV